MIYLEEKFNLIPASPVTLEEFVNFSQEKLVPICERLGARLIVAWYISTEWFSQVTQIMEFDDMEALKAFRINASQDSAWGEYVARLEEFSPERRSRLLEPLGPVPKKALDKAIRRSQRRPLKIYLVATLEVAPDKMTEFKTELEQYYKILPIIASWRPIGGSPNEVIDLWRGTKQVTDGFTTGYQPPDDFSKQFFGPLREMAPKEHAELVFTLPYAQLRRLFFIVSSKTDFKETIILSFFFSRLFHQQRDSLFCATSSFRQLSFLYL